MIHFRISFNQLNIGYPLIDFLNILKSIYGYQIFSLIFEYPKMYLQLSKNVFKDIPKLIMDILKQIYRYSLFVFGYQRIIKDIQ